MNTLVRVYTTAVLCSGSVMHLMSREPIQLAPITVQVDVPEQISYIESESPANREGKVRIHGKIKANSKQLNVPLNRPFFILVDGTLSGPFGFRKNKEKLDTHMLHINASKKAAIVPKKNGAAKK